MIPLMATFFVCPLGKGEPQARRKTSHAALRADQARFVNFGLGARLAFGFVPSRKLALVGLVEPIERFPHIPAFRLDAVDQ